MVIRMSDRPRLADLLRKPRRRRSLVTHDGTMIVQGESYPIAGEAIAMDERPRADDRAVTFDGAVQPRKI